MAKDITLKTRNGETRYPKSVTDLIFENGTGKTLQTIITELRQVDSDTDTRTRMFKADVTNLETLNKKTDIGLYNYVGNGWRGAVSINYDSADNVSQVALSSSTPSYNGNTLTWLSAQPCAMARTYTNGAWTHWEKVGAPVVNDLTTGGTDKALSAEMGKTLKEGLDALGPKLFQPSTNLYNKDDEDCVEGKYVDYLDGVLYPNVSLKISGWIPVKPSTYYIGYHANQMAWYDSTKTYISGAVTINNTAVQSPANAAYARVSFYLADESVNRLNEGETLLPYEDYGAGNTLKPELIPFKQDTLVSGENIKSVNGKSIVGSGNVTIEGDDVPLDASGFNILSSGNTQAAIDEVDGVFNDMLTKQTATNLYNKNDADCVSGKYVNYESGALASNANLKASGWIAVKPSTYYIGYRTNQMAWYDANKTYISGELNLTSAKQSPATAAFARISFYLANESENQLNEGQTLLPYEAYIEPTYILKEKYVKPYLPEIDDNKVNMGYNLAGTVRFINKAASLANEGRLAINTSPQDATCNTISLYAKVTSFSGGILIGKGPTTGLYCSWISIDSTSVKCYYQVGSNTIAQVGNDVAHGLTVSGFIKVTIITKCNKWEVYVSTLANGESANGVFYVEFNNAFYRGEPFVESIGASLTDVELMHNCNDIRKPIWAFGDSYFGSRTTNRVVYWLNQWGYAEKIMVNGWGGRASASALQDLQRCLAVGTPKMIIWCLGMNDNQTTIETWQNTLESVKALCEEKEIELVVATIPPVLGSTYINKDAMNQYLIANNYRLLDVVKAVGADTNGHWYGYGTAQDYQSSDNVHPSEYGAKAIAAQWLVDVPEITQY